MPAATTDRLRRPDPGWAARATGAAAVAFSLLYLLSDGIESFQGGFTPAQLWLTLVAEAAIPVFVLGLWRLQRPSIGRLGAFGAAAYAYAYVVFTASVVYALWDGTADFGALSHDLRPWMAVHGGVMVLAGICFGIAVARAGVLPRWTGWTLAVGVVLVSLASGGPEGVQLAAAGVRDAAFVGMGLAALRPGCGELRARPAVRPRPLQPTARMAAGQGPTRLQP